VTTLNELVEWLRVLQKEGYGDAEVIDFESGLPVQAFTSEDDNVARVYFGEAEAPDEDEEATPLPDDAVAYLSGALWTRISQEQIVGIANKGWRHHTVVTFIVDGKEHFVCSCREEGEV
jgi:hypothetical protein